MKDKWWTEYSVLTLPFLLTLLWIVGEVNSAAGQISWEEIPPIVVVFEAFAGLVVLFTVALVRNAARAALVASVVLILCLNYRFLRTLFMPVFHALAGNIVPPWLSLAFIFLVGGLIVAGAARPVWHFRGRAYQVNYDVLNTFLGYFCLTAGIVVVLQLCTLAHTLYVNEKVAAQLVDRYKRAFNVDGWRTSGQKPDVYYFLIDGFAHEQTMREYLGLERSELFDYLRSKGFYVAGRSHSNYDRTHFSLASSLNMQYIHDAQKVLAASFKSDPTDEHLLQFSRLSQDSAVASLFKSLGYRFYAVGEYRIPNADRSWTLGLTNMLLNQMVMLTPQLDLEHYVPLLRLNMAESRLLSGKSLPELVKLPGPKFAFLYSDIVHTPPIFDEQGRILPLPVADFFWLMGSRKEMADQMKFGEHTIVRWLDEVLSAYPDNNKPVIIIQSDHGPFIDLYAQHSVDEYFNKRMRILNAYYFPRIEKTGLYSEISPVNSFRLLFDDYFSANLPLLPDYAWCSPDYPVPFAWQEVKNKLRFSPEFSRQYH